MISFARFLFRCLPVKHQYRRDLAYFIFRLTGDRLSFLPTYPQYLREEKWPKEIPPEDLNTYRESVLGTHFAAEHGPAMVMLSHTMGGGTQQHVDDLAARLESESWRVFYLERHDAAHLRLIAPGYKRGAPLYFRWPQETGALQDALKRLNITQMHLHHTLDFPENFRMHLEALTGSGLPYDFTIHDYFSICPRFTLYDEAVRGYCGEPEDVRKCDACIHHLGSRLKQDVNVAQWREDYAAIITGARKVFVPDADVEQRLRRYFPNALFSVKPHPEKQREMISIASVRAPGERLRVVTVGGLAPHKGSKVLLDCAQDALKRDLPVDFTLIGHSDIEQQLKTLRNVRVTGHYIPEQLTGLLSNGNYHLAFLPSVIPETYNYTLSECWRHGLYTVGLDIGAIASRIKASPDLGTVLPYDWYYKPEKINDALLNLHPLRLNASAVAQALQDYVSIQKDYYGF